MSEQESGTFKSKIAKLYKFFKGCLGAIVIFFIIILIISSFMDSSKEKSSEQIEAQREKLAKIKEEKEKKEQEKENKEQEYKKTYGETLYDAEHLYKIFKEKPIQINKICNNSRPPMQIWGEILDMGTNSYGNYIDLYTDKEKSEKKGNIRVFLAASEWNNKAITKIKIRNMIVVGGLCYGQTEAFGIKTKVIIGNATILKVNGDLL